MLKDIDYIRAGVNYVGNFMVGYFERGEQMSMEARISNALDEIDDVFHREHGYRLKASMTECANEKYKELLERIMPELTERLEGLPMKIKKMMMKRAINQQTAEALITGYLKYSGLSYSLETQANRARITVDLNKKKYARFYIYYKNLYDDLEKLLPAVESLNNLIDTFGYYFKVC
ncbi:MAG: hypothetical protein IJN30_00825 [Bacteroidales bacterium]|nr:hypothetical protein [Bacteroidales bacterium]